MQMWSSSSQERKVELNVYQFAQVGERTNGLLSSMSMGVYHTGVVVENYEYSFNDAGVFRTKPRAIEGDQCIYKETIVLGRHEGTANEFRGLINELKREFAPGSYNLMTKNCNHFANAMALKLCDTAIPTHLNRIASLGAAFLGSSNTKAYQVKSAASSDTVHANDSKPTSFWSGLFSSSSSDAVEPPAASSTTKKKKKELTPQQQALLDKVRGGASTSSATPAR